MRSIYIYWLEWLRVGIPDFQNVWCLNITSNFLIPLIPIFLQLSANPASYTGIETLTSSWLLNNIWVEEELNFKSFAEEIQKETRKDIKQEDIQPGSEYLRFQWDILRVLGVYTMKLNQTLNTAFDTAKFIVLCKKGKKMCALHRVFPTLSIIVLISFSFIR